MSAEIISLSAARERHAAPAEEPDLRRYTDRGQAADLLAGAIRFIEEDHINDALRFARLAVAGLEKMGATTIAEDIARAKRRARAAKGAQTRWRNKHARERRGDEDARQIDEAGLVAELSDILARATPIADE